MRKINGETAESLSEKGACPCCGGTSGFTWKAYLTADKICSWGGRVRDIEAGEFYSSKPMNKTVKCLDCNKMFPNPFK